MHLTDYHAKYIGDLKSFREQFTSLNNARVFETLKARLQPVCKRTLRRQVLAYVPFTKRHPLMQPFTPKESEDRLYHLVSDWLGRHADTDRVTGSRTADMRSALVDRTGL